MFGENKIIIMKLILLFLREVRCFSLSVFNDILIYFTLNISNIVNLVHYIGVNYLIEEFFDVALSLFMILGFYALNVIFFNYIKNLVINIIYFNLHNLFFLNVY